MFVIYGIIVKVMHITSLLLPHERGRRRKEAPRDLLTHSTPVLLPFTSLVKSTGCYKGTMEPGPNSFS